MTDRDTGGLVFIAPLWLCLDFKDWEWGVGGGEVFKRKLEQLRCSWKIVIEDRGDFVVVVYLFHYSCAKATFFFTVPQKL